MISSLKILVKSALLKLLFQQHLTLIPILNLVIFISILAPVVTNGAYIEDLMFDESYFQHLNEWLFPENT